MGGKRKGALKELSSQSGLIVLATVTLLLGLASLAALYAAQLFSQHHGMAMATVNQLQAKMLADSLMNAALQQLERDPRWQGDMGSLPNPHAAQGKITWTTKELSLAGFSQTLFRLKATGLSEDKQRSQSVFADAVRSPLLRNLPLAALTLPAGLTANIQFELSVNSDGLGPNKALSIWSMREVGLNPNSVTCSNEDFMQKRCFENSISSVHMQGNDIVDKSNRFPDDVFAHLFDFSVAEYPYIKAKSASVIEDCSTLNAQANAMIWVAGECIVSANTEIGSELNPVILVVEGGKLELGAFAKVFGLVLMLDPAKHRPVALNMQFRSYIVGALVLSEPLSADSTGIRVSYDSAVLARLQTHPMLQHIMLIAGSWRDYEYQ